MTSAKTPNPLIEALIHTLPVWPILAVRLLAALPESVALCRRFARPFQDLLAARLSHSARSSALGAVWMLAICWGCQRLPDEDWSLEWKTAFSLLGEPRLQTIGLLLWLGTLMLLAQRLEVRWATRHAALAGLPAPKLATSTRRLNYVTFGVLALLVLWHGWYFVGQVPRYGH